MRPMISSMSECCGPFRSSHCKRVKEDDTDLELVTHLKKCKMEHHAEPVVPSAVAHPSLFKKQSSVEIEQVVSEAFDSRRKNSLQDTFTAEQVQDILRIALERQEEILRQEYDALVQKSIQGRERECVISDECFSYVQINYRILVVLMTIMCVSN